MVETITSAKSLPTIEVVWESPPHTRPRCPSHTNEIENLPAPAIFMAQDHPIYLPAVKDNVIGSIEFTTCRGCSVMPEAA